ncbi:MAG: diacylglycerol/polyprenol kinase family protein [Halanaeroarchaeum sp.]
MSEIDRRLVHASGSAIPVSSLLGVPWRTVQWFVLAGAVLAIALEAFRLQGDLDWWIYDRLTRDYERDGVAGYAYFAIGYAIVAWVFAPPFAIAAMLMLSIGDPIAGLLSNGRRQVKRSGVLLVTFAVSLSIASLLGIPLPTAVAGAGVATFADGITLRVGSWFVDDNLTIPVGAAAAMALVASL